MKLLGVCQRLDQKMSPLLGPDDERYEDFYQHWMEEQKKQLQELRDALDSDMQENQLKQLNEKVLNHYVRYYKAKDRAAKQDVLKVVHPLWRSPLENAFSFIGGWRPTMVFQLAYAQAGQQIEAELAEFLSGIDTPNMASLSATQLQRISALQEATQKSEEELEHRMAILQQGMADQPLLSLAQADAKQHEKDEADTESVLETAMDDKLKVLEEIVVAADNLRMETLTKMLTLLNAVQAAQYLVAAAQIHIAIRDLGKKRNGVNGIGHNLAV